MPDAESALKRSAQRRLIGAIALALATVVVLPMLFDTEPPPVSDDVEIVIPSRELPGSMGVSGMDGPSPTVAAPSVPNAPPVAVPSPAVPSPAAPAPAPAQPAPNAAKGAQSTVTFLQLGAFSSAGSAKTLAQRVANAGFTVNVVEDNGRYKVRCGPFSAQAAAQAMQGQLRAKGFVAVMVNP
jgi:DedD protein